MVMRVQDGITGISDRKYLFDTAVSENLRPSTIGLSRRRRVSSRPQTSKRRLGPTVLNPLKSTVHELQSYQHLVRCSYKKSRIYLATAFGSALLISFGSSFHLFAIFQVNNDARNPISFHDTDNSVQTNPSRLEALRPQPLLSTNVPLLRGYSSTATNRGNDFAILFPVISLRQSFRYPSAYQGSRSLAETIDQDPDFGELEISFYPASTPSRMIRPSDDHTKLESPQEDETTDSYAQDDDIIESAQATLLQDSNDDDAIDYNHIPNRCQRIQEHRLSFPTCNEFHQLDHTASNLLPSGYAYVNRGYFREVFSLDHLYRKDTLWRFGRDRLALKQIRYKDSDATHEYFEYVRMDAIVAERLTASPRIYDIYGYCGLSILSEYFYHGDIEKQSILNDGFLSSTSLDDEEGVDPQNDLTPEQKLVLGLEMAEALADLHGYSNGLIIHDDIQMSQFLLNRNQTRLKLNDFNRAEFPMWDGTKYCRYQNGKGRGIWRSPEEYQDLPLTESIDVWSLGNNLYGLLTGLNPLYDSESVETTQTRIIKGEVGFVDPRYSKRSKAERALVRIIKKCFEYEPGDRPTIFEVVQELQRAVEKLLEQKGISRESILKEL